MERRRFLVRAGALVGVAVIRSILRIDRSNSAPAWTPPALPGGQSLVSDTSPEFLKPPPTLRSDVVVAKTPPTIDFMFFPGQSYAGRPWSNWGDSLCAHGKYYTSIGDHLAPGGNAFVFEYDPATRRLRQLVDVKGLLALPDGHYTPGKIHGRLDLGADGWLYFSTHRGATNVTTDRYHYKGDWILRVDPKTAKCEIVAQGPVPKHCIPCSVLDPQRLLFYGGTAPGSGGDGDGIRFFAYDVGARKLRYAGPDGPARYLAFASSTGRIYFNPAGSEESVVRFDPAKPDPPIKRAGTLGIRAATQETPQGFIYTAANGQRDTEACLWSLNTKTEQIENLGPLAVGTQSYVATLDASPDGRYLYYMPGAHGGSDQDGTPIVQFDVKTRAKKVLAFLASFYRDKYSCTPVGTYSSAVDPQGDKLFITWNLHRSGRAWDCCGLMVVRVPESER